MHISTEINNAKKKIANKKVDNMINKDKLSISCKYIYIHTFVNFMCDVCRSAFAKSSFLNIFQKLRQK